MRAARYRLRFVPGVSVTGATYGASTYGGTITYGQRASDLISAFRYRVVPLPSGWPTQPAWVRRVDDLDPPMQGQILGDDSQPLSLAALTVGWFVITPIDERNVLPYVLPATVDDPANGIVSYSWTVGAIYGSSTFGGPITYGQQTAVRSRLPIGTYRVVIVLVMNSGRRMSVPTDDNLQLVVLANGASGA